MINLYDDNVIVFDMWNKGFFKGLHELSFMVANWLTSLKEEKVKVIFDMIEIKEGEHIAFASALIQFQAISSDNIILRRMKSYLSITFFNQQSLKLIHRKYVSPTIVLTTIN